MPVNGRGRYGGKSVDGGCERINEHLSAHFAISDNVKPDPFLERNGGVYRPILDALKVDHREIAGLQSSAGVLEIVWTEQRADRLGAKRDRHDTHLQQCIEPHSA